MLIQLLSTLFMGWRVVRSPLISRDCRTMFFPRREIFLDIAKQGRDGRADDETEAEGGADGPVFSLKGLANDIYYHLDAEDRRRYRDYTGCGNTINANHPVVAQLLQQCVDYWAREMHVDGFRFDLASVLSRDIQGHPQANPPILWDIETDPVNALDELG